MDDKRIVNAWIEDVARVARDRDNLIDALRSERRVLEELERMPPTYQDRLEPTRARLVAVIGMLEERERDHAEKIPEFLSIMEELPDPLVARALVLRVMQGKTWKQCAMSLYVNRTHLERLYRKSMPDLVRLVPSRYR